MEAVAAMGKQSRDNGKYQLQLHIRQAHEKRLLLALMHHGPLSRAALSRTLSLSITSASALSERLLSAGLIEWAQQSAQQPAGGRPAELLCLRKDALCLAVLSARPTGLVVARFHLNLQEEDRAFFPYPSAFHAPQAEQFAGFPVVSAQAFCDFALACLRKGGCGVEWEPSALLLSLPGNVMEPEAYFVSAPLGFALYGDFVSPLRETLELPVVLGNDADYYAYAQKGMPGEEDSFVFVHLNDGVGAGILHHGELFRSGRHHAPELGHLSIDYQGPPCRCGARGCLEGYIGFPAIAAQASKLWGREIGIEDVILAYRQGEEQARALMEGVAHKLAAALSSMLAVFETQRIVLGGGAPLFGPDFLEAFRRQMQSGPVRRTVRSLPVDFPKDPSLDDCTGAARHYIEKIWKTQT